MVGTMQAGPRKQLGLCFAEKIRKINSKKWCEHCPKKLFLIASDMQTTDSSFYSQMKEKRLRFDMQHVLLRLKVVVTECRKRIVYCSAEEDEVAAPRAHDEIFCG